MIIVQLAGGLGNQMFQYAAGRRLAMKHGTPLVLDISWFDDIAGGVTPRSYQLDRFAIQARIATRKQVARITWGYLRPSGPGLVRRIQRKFGLGTPPIIREVETGVFQPEVLDAPGTAYLTGYWQCEKYFKDIRATLCKDFTLRTPPDAQNREMADQIAAVESVCLHIRRGDYVSNPVHAPIHGALSLEYYQVGIRRIADHISEPRFFVFSDDPQWARDNLNIEYPWRVVDHNGADKPHDDLWLMTHCKHHIVANSSFSWWGAWLAGHPRQLVIAPERWFLQLAMPDIVPDGWQRIPA